MFSDLHNKSDGLVSIPENPLKAWRNLFETKALEIKEIVQYFQIVSPFFITIEQKDSTTLGEFLIFFVGIFPFGFVIALLGSIFSCMFVEISFFFTFENYFCVYKVLKLEISLLSWIWEFLLATRSRKCIKICTILVSIE